MLGEKLATENCSRSTAILTQALTEVTRLTATAEQRRLEVEELLKRLSRQDLDARAASEADKEHMRVLKEQPADISLDQLLRSLSGNDQGGSR